MSVRPTKNRPHKYADDALVPFVPERVSLAVELSGLSVNAAAKAMGESQQTLAEIVQGNLERTRPSRLAKIAKLAGWPVTVEWLTGSSTFSGPKARRLGYFPPISLDGRGTRGEEQRRVVRQELEALRLAEDVQRAFSRDRRQRSERDADVGADEGNEGPGYPEVATLLSLDFWTALLGRPTKDEVVLGHSPAQQDEFTRHMVALLRLVLAPWLDARQELYPAAIRSVQTWLAMMVEQSRAREGSLPGQERFNALVEQATQDAPSEWEKQQREAARRLGRTEEDGS